MRNPNSPVTPDNPPAVKPGVDVVFEYPFFFPEDMPIGGPDPCMAAPLETQLKMVQIGVWEARRRWLAGHTDALGMLLAHLDEDVERLRQALGEDTPEEETREPETVAAR